MIHRRPSRRLLRAALWTGAAVLAAVFAVLLLTPQRKASIHEAEDRLAPAMSGANEGADKDGAAPERGDALRRADRREAVGSEAGRVEVVGGFNVLRLDAEIQERSGLRTQVLKSVDFAPQIAAFGRVADIQPLLAQRARYTSAQGQADVARATLAAFKAEYDRLSALRKEEGDIATKRIQQAEAEWKRNQAEMRRFEADTEAVRDETRQQWGQVLTVWALGGASPEFDRLIKHQDALLLVTLPPGQTLPAGTETVQVARDGDRANAVPAAYVSPAPVSDPVIQGETHFFRTAAAGLRAAMRLDVWVDEAKSAATGVVIPQSAVIWALGQSWTYVQIDNTHFVRRPVSTKTEAPGGWFVNDTVKPGDTVVVAGAQMLYAEEFRWQIRDEDNN